MKLVKPGLFIGTREDANNEANLKQCNMKRVLTVDIQVPDDLQCGPDKITRLHVDRLDEPTADLLSSFDRCIQFIEEGIRNNEAVLVHWYDHHYHAYMLQYIQLASIFRMFNNPLIINDDDDDDDFLC